MIEFTSTEGVIIRNDEDSSADLEDLCYMFERFIAALGYDKSDLMYHFEDAAGVESMSLDDLCDGWRKVALKRVKVLDTRGDEEVIEATIDVVALDDKYRIRRMKSD